MTKRQYRRRDLCRNKRSDMKTLFARLLKYIEQKYQQDNLLTLSAHHYLITSLKWRIYRSDLRSALRAASGIQLANSRYLFAKSTYTDDVDRDYQWIAQQFYHILFRPFGKSLVDNKRRCAWYFGRDLPAHNHQVPDNFDMIRLVPQRHYICF